MSNWQPKGNSTKPGNPLWNEYENEDTGESTLEIHTPQRISSYDTCEHFFVVDGHDAICKKCGFGQRFILGLQTIKNGEIINLDQKNIKD